MNTAFPLTLTARPEQAASRKESHLHKRFTVCFLVNLVGDFLRNLRLQKDSDPSRDSECNKKSVTATHSVITLQRLAREFKKVLVTAKFTIKCWRTLEKEMNFNVANARQPSLRDPS